MKETEIYQNWTLPPGNKQASVDMWDSMAPSFGLGELPTRENDSFFRLLSEKQMFDKHLTILDVGCGTGRYALALAPYCAKVVGTDLSPKMLSVAQERAEDIGVSNVGFVCQDWHELDLTAAGYERAFDLVFAHMTPAIQSAETFMKLTEASRGWCAMSKPTRRTDTVSDALKSMFGLDEKRESSDDDILYAFELIWQRGMQPYLEYENQQWNMKKTLEEAYGLFINRLKTYRELTPTEEEKAKAYLQSIAVDGIVSEQTNTIITTMYWKII